MRITELMIITTLSVLLLAGCQVEVEVEGFGGSNENTLPEANTLSNSETSNNNDQTSSSSVTLYWSAPLERVNGELMNSTEIAGYEVRFKTELETSYTNVLISDPSIDQYNVSELSNAEAYTFEVAVFDNDGIYSDFVIALAN